MLDYKTDNRFALFAAPPPSYPLVFVLLLINGIFYND